MKHNVKFLALFLIIILAVCGCTKQEPSTNNESTEQKTDMQGGASEDIQIYVDGVGREVRVPKQINSISALYTVVGHIVIMLDQGELVTSCSKGLKRDILILHMVPQIEDIYMPKNSGNINIEELLRSEPDIIFIDAPTYWDKTQMETIEKLDIPYYVIDFNSMQEEINIVRDIANILGSQEEGQRYIDFYEKAIKQADQIVSSIPEDKKLTVYHSINEAVRTSPEGTLTAEWLEKAGCINVALDKEIAKSEDKYYTTLEDILLWNPEVILVNEPDTYDYIKRMKAWENIDAVKNEHTFLLPTGVSRWGHATSLETPLAILWTLKTIYPEYSKGIDIEKITKDFYLDLFEYELSEEEVIKILRGYDMRKAKELE